MFVQLPTASPSEIFQRQTNGPISRGKFIDVPRHSVYRIRGKASAEELREQTEFEQDIYIYIHEEANYN